MVLRFGLTSVAGNDGRPRRALFQVAAIFAFAAFACGPWSGAFADGPIKIGLSLTYVGPTSIFARYEDKGARLLVEQTNKSGGIGGRQIELVNYDTEGKPDRAGTLYRRLAQEDDVAAVVGPDSIFVLLGMSDIPSDVKVMSVSSPGLYELVAPPKRRYIVSAQVSTTFAGTLVLGYVKDKFHAKRVGMITTSDLIGQTIAKTVGNMAAAFGMDLVDVASQPASDRDLLPSLRKLATLEPKIDALYVFGSGPFANIAMNQVGISRHQRSHRLQRRQRDPGAHQGFIARHGQAHIPRRGAQHGMVELAGERTPGHDHCKLPQRLSRQIWRRPDIAVGRRI